MPSTAVVDSKRCWANKRRSIFADTKTLRAIHATMASYEQRRQANVARNLKMFSAMGLATSAAAKPAAAPSRSAATPKRRKVTAAAAAAAAKVPTPGVRASKRLRGGPAAAEMATLRAIEPLELEIGLKTVDLSFPQVISIGRSKNAGIRLTRPQQEGEEDSLPSVISRTHAQLHVEVPDGGGPPTLRIVDKGSTNGVAVNDVRVSSAQLRHGAVFRLGGCP